jgi:hypothetical protein
MSSRPHISLAEVFEFCKEPRSQKHIQEFFDISLGHTQQLLRVLRTDNRVKSIRPLSGNDHYMFVSIVEPVINALPAHDPFNLIGRRHDQHNT